MELNELKSTWQTLEKALERGNRLSAAILRQRQLDAVNKSLRPLKLNQAFQIALGVFFIFLAGVLWSTKPTAISVIVSGVLVQAYGIGCVITAGIVFSSLSRVDYSAPVVEMQSGLARVRRAYGVCVLVAGLSWWFLWMPLLMLLGALAGVNLYAHAPKVIWMGTAIGIAGSLCMYGLYVYSQRSLDVSSNVGLNTGFRGFIEHATFGQSLQNALQQLREIRKFEEEVSA